VVERYACRSVLIIAGLRIGSCVIRTPIERRNWGIVSPGRRASSTGLQLRSCISPKASSSGPPEVVGRCPSLHLQLRCISRPVFKPFSGKQEAERNKRSRVFTVRRSRRPCNAGFVGVWTTRVGFLDHSS
jgi:hypothetical protein